jgi:hypothetical protein
MSRIIGGSAYAMAHQISEGYVLVTERTFKGLAASDLQQIGFEIEKLLKSLRGEQPPSDDHPALQARHRKIQRLTSCRTQLQSYRQRFRV